MREVLLKTRKSEKGLYDTIQVLDENGKLIWCKFVHHKDKEKLDETVTSEETIPGEGSKGSQKKT